MSKEEGNGGDIEGDDAEDAVDYVATGGGDDDDDDEATLEEEEGKGDNEDPEVELATLQQDQDVPLEELKRRYAHKPGEDEDDEEGEEENDEDDGDDDEDYEEGDEDDDDEEGEEEDDEEEQQKKVTHKRKADVDLSRGKSKTKH